MTFDSAIRSLSDGKAAKVASWGGYIYRTDIGTAASAYNPDSTYNKDDLCVYGGLVYICTTDGTTGTWSSLYWVRSTLPYTLTFRKRANVDGNPVDVSYTYTPHYFDGNVILHAEPDGTDLSPDEDSSDSASEEFAKMMPLDGGLLQAFQSSDWVVGTKVEFEVARTGEGRIW